MVYGLQWTWGGSQIEVLKVLKKVPVFFPRFSNLFSGWKYLSLKNDRNRSNKKCRTIKLITTIKFSSQKTLPIARRQTPIVKVYFPIH